jgi:hypothetical protein
MIVGVMFVAAAALYGMTEGLLWLEGYVHDQIGGQVAQQR